ncbi:MAG: hypothetical protein JW991_05105 [Candidatus Pacebacteria bacterium]|nr:hypothetical protein [Candidatus Paceibacterota bacterium]
MDCAEKQNRQKIFFANLVSFVFSPLISVNYGLISLIWRSMVRDELAPWQFLCLLTVFMVIPTAFFLFEVSRGRLDFDLMEKKERFRFYIFCLGCGFLGLNLTYYFSQDLFRLLLIFTFTGLVFAVTTFWDKASLHVGSLTSVYLVLNLFNRGRFFYFLPIIPLVGWSRVFLEKHSLSQVLEGVIIPGLIIPAGLLLFKII